MMEVYELVDSGESQRIEKCFLEDGSWQRQSDDMEDFVYFCVSSVKYNAMQGVNEVEVGSCRLVDQFHRQLSFV